MTFRTAKTYVPGVENRRPMDDTHPLSRSEREMLKGIYRLITRDGEAHTGDLAEALGVSPSTVTTGVKRLSERGLVDHVPYQTIELTDAGSVAAVACIRRHRIVERFLADMLGYAWNEADRLAASFEHELPQEVEDRIFTALDHPDSCPHGFPIPEPATGVIATLPPLYSLEPGDRAVVAVPGSTDPEVAAFLNGLGLVPGGQVEVKEKHPFDGPLVVAVGGTDCTLGSTVANQVYVKQLNKGD